MSRRKRRHVCPHPEFKGKDLRCILCGDPLPGSEFDHILRALIGNDAPRVRHVRPLDEQPPEPERFSGGVYVGARERNLARLRFYLNRATNELYVGKWALRWILANVPRDGRFERAQMADERAQIRARMAALGLSTEGLAS